MRPRWMILATVALSLAIAGTAAEAAEVKVISTIGVKMALPDIIAEFERTTGHKVSITYGTASLLKTRILEGETADAAILTAPIVDDLIKEGRLATGSRVDLAKSGAGFCVKAGAPKPDIGTPEALKRTLLAAKSIGYSKAGASGVLLMRVAERLGIADQIKPKLVDTTGLVGEVIAKGEAEIGTQQIPELMSVPGVDVVGPYPGELQVITTFSAGLDAKAKEAEAAKALLKFLSGAAAGVVYKSKGLDPA
jgi:molybdate transport system substrate-binding protein